MRNIVRSLKFQAPVLLLLLAAFAPIFAGVSGCDRVYCKQGRQVRTELRVMEAEVKLLTINKPEAWSGACEKLTSQLSNFPRYKKYFTTVEKAIGTNNPGNVEAYWLKYYFYENSELQLGVQAVCKLVQDKADPKDVIEKAKSVFEFFDDGIAGWGTALYQKACPSAPPVEN